VSEDYLYALEKDVGVVVDDFVRDDVKKAWQQIKAYLMRDPQELKRHCREVGLEYRGFAGLNTKFREALVSLIIK
jgi:hypothetical protein